MWTHATSLPIPVLSVSDGKHRLAIHSFDKRVLNFRENGHNMMTSSISSVDWM